MALWVWTQPTSGSAKWSVSYNYLLTHKRHTALDVAEAEWRPCRRHEVYSTFSHSGESEPETCKRKHSWYTKTLSMVQFRLPKSPNTSTKIKMCQLLSLSASALSMKTEPGLLPRKEHEQLCDVKRFHWNSLDLTLRTALAPKVVPLKGVGFFSTLGWSAYITWKLGPVYWLN